MSEQEKEKKRKKCQKSKKKIKFFPPISLLLHDLQPFLECHFSLSFHIDASFVVRVVGEERKEKRKERIEKRIERKEGGKQDDKRRKSIKYWKDSPFNNYLRVNGVN